MLKLVKNCKDLQQNPKVLKKNAVKHVVLRDILNCVNYLYEILQDA